MIQKNFYFADDLRAIRVPRAIFANDQGNTEERRLTLEEAETLTQRNESGYIGFSSVWEDNPAGLSAKQACMAR